MRKLIFPLVLLLGLMFLIINLTEVQQIVETFKRGDWRYIFLAFFVQIILTVSLAATIRALYYAVGLQERLERLIILYSGANFVNVIAPAGGASGLAVFIANARRRGQSTARVTVAGGVFVLLEYFAFMFVLFMGLIVLVRRNNLNAPELTATGALFFIALILAILFLLGMHSSEILGRTLAWIARQANRFLWLFIHREVFSEERAHAFAHDAGVGLRELRAQPSSLIVPFLLSLTSKALLILVLFLVFVAFKVPFSIGTLIGGFSIGYLFWIVSPTPAGIGFVEGALTLGLTTLNVSLANATVVTLAFRGITFWVPLFFGMLAFHLLLGGKVAEVSI
jgi:uncharacterized protein (TIRG00374 family)